MKPNEYRENAGSTGPRRVFVRFAVTYAAAIPIRDASIGNIGHHATLDLTGERTLNPHGLCSSDECGQEGYGQIHMPIGPSPLAAGLG